jgi:outer membrane protein
VAVPFLVFTLVASTTARAETAAGASSTSLSEKLGLSNPARVMSLKDALAYADAHQPSLQAALDRVKAAQADAQVPRAGWLPRAGMAAELFGGTANNTTASYLNVREVDLPRIGGTPVSRRGSWSPSASTLTAVSLGQELLDFGKIAAQSAAADAAIEVERYRAAAERLAVDLVVKEAYFAVQGAKTVLRAARDAYERTRVHRDLAAAGVKSGLFAPIEQTRAEADLARFEVQRLHAEGGVLSAQAVLAAAVGAPDGLLDTSDETLPTPELPAFDQAIREGLERDPILHEVAARLRSQRAGTRAIQAESRPSLALSATLSGRAGGATPSSGATTATGEGFLPDVPNWDVGLVLRWPLYDGVVAARARASAARERVLMSDAAVLTQQELKAIQQAFVSTEIARDSLASLERSVDAARANYAQAEARFKAGLGTALELADAEYLRTDAEIQLAGGRFELSRARAVLGKLLAEES